MRKHQPNFNYHCPSSLYKLVFGSWLIKSAIAILFWAILIQPVSLIYASETENEVVTEAVTEVDSTLASEPVSESAPEAVAEEIQIDLEAVAETFDNEDQESENDKPVTEIADDTAINTTEVPEQSESATFDDENGVAVVIDEISSIDVTDSIRASTTLLKNNSTGTVVAIDKTTEKITSSTTNSVVVSTDQAITLLLPNDEFASTTTIEVSTTSSSAGTTSITVILNETTLPDQKNTLENPPVEDYLTIRSDKNQIIDIANEVDSSEDSASSSTSTIDPSLVTAPIQLLTNDGNRHQFADTQCVSVGNGAFYCSKDKAGADLAPKEGVYAEQDSDGDLEIFFNHNGNTHKITDNLYKLAKFNDS